MLSVVCWRWKPKPGYRSEFLPATVHTMRNMVRRHYQKPHRFICVTDDPAGIEPDIEIVPLWNDFSNLESPHGGRGKNPSCYRRLRMFRPDIAEVFGPRFVSIDLDCVVTGDLSPLFDRTEDFVIWGDTHPRTPYNGSLMMLTAGARPQVWDKFDPDKSPREAKDSGFWGSDQGWISYVLGPNEARWGTQDGVYSYRNHLSSNPYKLPANARLVSFHGRIDPWTLQAKELDWVKAHYC